MKFFSSALGSDKPCTSICTYLAAKDSWYDISNGILHTCHQFGNDVNCLLSNDIHGVPNRDNLILESFVVSDLTLQTVGAVAALSASEFSEV